MKKIIQLVLVLAILGLAYVLYSNINKPIEFEKAYNLRKLKVVERLKEIRALQEAYKSVNNKYTNSFDSLESFYNNGKMTTTISIGSTDDSLTMARTNAYVKAYDEQQKLIKARRPIKGEKLVALNELSIKKAEELGVAARIPVLENVKDAVKVDTVLLSKKPGFDIKQIRYVPGVVVDGVEEKPEFQMEAKLKETSSNLMIPLFEAKVDNSVFLKGLDKQQIANKNDEISKKAVNNYHGLKVGDIENPNNNAGNWE